MAHWREDRTDDMRAADDDLEVRQFTGWAVSLAATLSAIFIVAHFGI